MILTMRPATVEDAVWIGEHLRDADEAEVNARGSSGSQAVPNAFILSRQAYSIRLTVNGRAEQNPAVIFGVTDGLEDGFGVVWLLATHAIHRAPLSILREARHWLNYFGSLYPKGLHTIADTRNDLHLRWLRLTGFTLASQLEIGGQTFQHAIRRSYV